MKPRKLLASLVVASGFGVVFACSSSNQVGFDDGGTFAETGSDQDGGLGDTGFTGSDVTFGGDVTREVGGPSDGSLFQDALPEASNADGACVNGDAGPPPFPQHCTAPTSNECDGNTDAVLTSLGIGASFLNGSGGNGFDDDCDGLVDEGCACPGNGQTKDCYLVPPSQADPATHKPVGWCTDNSKGSLDCAGVEFPKWSGTCRGALPPYAHDICAPGDFNCDGLQQNSDIQDCTCKIAVVTCPTTPITEAPYPDPKNIKIIDGSLWIGDPASRTQSTNWAWTVVGGDCDNVLPHPTYLLYNKTDSTIAGARVAAVRTGVHFDPAQNPPRYVANASDPLIALQKTAYGNGVAGGQVFPAFGLSGDYIVQGEFDLQGKHYVCTQKVQVRAPGVRAELCWDTVGGDNGGGNDIDLHFARLQAPAGQTCPNHGWETNCPLGTTYEDCWYGSESGCRDFSSAPPNWGYANSANAACLGWSSRRSPTGTVLCSNPRLDKDNVTCDRSIDDPTNVGGGILGGGGFCGPENINLDNPNDNDAFVVAVNHYANHGGTSTAKTHVNMYCNGQRVISVGYNPVTGQISNPALLTGGADSTGDYWIVGTIKAHVQGGQLQSCDVATIPSHNPDPTRDGPGATQLCVESTLNASTPQFRYTNHLFVENVPLQGVPAGSIPTVAGQFCKH